MDFVNEGSSIDFLIFVRRLLADEQCYFPRERQILSVLIHIVKGLPVGTQTRSPCIAMIHLSLSVHGLGQHWLESYKVESRTFLLLTANHITSNRSSQ